MDRPQDRPGLLTEEDQAAPEERPPGGKALLRLVEILSRSGLYEVAQQTVDAAVAEQAPVVMSVAASMGLEAPPTRGSRSGGATARRPTARARQKIQADSAEAATSYTEDWLEAASQLGPPTPTGPQWRSLGPATIINGQTYGATRVNVSGRVSAMAIDPSNAAHVLAGAAHGGVWESFDGGGSWAPRTDYQATLTVGALAFDPRDPATVYCGSGEGDWWSFLGNGVLRSSDGGRTWISLATNPFVGQGFYALVVDPSNTARLLAGTTNGLFVSTDSGVNWTRARPQRSWSISAAANGSEVLAACADGVQSSTDGGVAPVRLPSLTPRLLITVAGAGGGRAMPWGCLVPGGFVIVDDYGGIEACRQAVTDHRASHDITAEIHPVDWTAVWSRKPFER